MKAQLCLFSEIEMRNTKRSLKFSVESSHFFIAQQKELNTQILILLFLPFSSVLLSIGPSLSSLPHLSAESVLKFTNHLGFPF